MRYEDAMHLANDSVSEMGRLRVKSRSVREVLPEGVIQAFGVPSARALLPAVGVVPSNKADGWKVAIRPWSEQGARLPEIEGLMARARGEVDLRITGKIRARPSPTGRMMQQKVRPLRAGHSVGHHRITAGTLGAFVEDERGHVLLLSNNHVLANTNDARRGDPVLQPARSDGGRRPAAVVGWLGRYKPLRSDRNNRIDAAVAHIEDAYQPDDLTLPGIGDVRGHWLAVEQSLVVRKVGRTTGLTRGRVSALNLRSIAVDYGGVVFRFDDVIEVEGSGATRTFSAAGDSGSLVVDEDRYAIGLLFAGDNEASYLNPIGAVLDDLDLQLIR